MKNFKVKLTFESYLCVANGIHFRHTNGCSCESVKVFETENVLTWEGLETPTFGFMPNVLTIWAISAGHLLSHVFKHRLWLYRYFWSKVNIWNVNCARATAFIFDTRMGVLLWKCQSFWDRKCLDLRGARAPTFGFMPNALTIWAIRARHLISHVFEHWLFSE